MRRIYKIDLGLLIAAAAIAAMLTARPVSSQIDGAQQDATASVASEVSAAIQKTREFFETWVSNEEDPANSQ